MAAKRQEIQLPATSSDIIAFFDNDESKAIDFLDEKIDSGELPFPYRLNFMPSPEDMMQALRDYEPDIRTEQYKLLSYFPRPLPGGKRGAMYRQQVFVRIQHTFFRVRKHMIKLIVSLTTIWKMFVFNPIGSMCHLLWITGLLEHFLEVRYLV